MRLVCRPTSVRYAAAVAAAVALGPGGCRRSVLPGAGAGDTPVVATVDGAPIHASALAAQMRRQRVERAAALEQLVTFEVLARAAASAGVRADEDQVTREALRAVKVQRLVEREIEPHLTPASIDEAEVRAVYERGKARFVHERLVQIAVLCLFTGARMKAEPRARAEKNGRLLKAFLDGHGHATHTLAELEAISRDPAWIDRKVSFTTVWQGNEQPFPKVVGAAVQGLTRPGQVTDLVGDETGYYLALYLAEKAPQNVSFAEAETGLRNEMYQPWRRQKFLQLSLAMAQGHDIEVFPENFPLLRNEGSR